MQKDSIVLKFILGANGYGGTFADSLFLSICLQDCYIEIAIRSGGSGSGGDGGSRA